MAAAVSDPAAGDRATLPGGGAPWGRSPAPAEHSRDGRRHRDKQPRSAIKGGAASPRRAATQRHQGGRRHRDKQPRSAIKGGGGRRSPGDHHIAVRITAKLRDGMQTIRRSGWCCLHAPGSKLGATRIYWQTIQRVGIRPVFRGSLAASGCAVLRSRRCVFSRGVDQFLRGRRLGDVTDPRRQRAACPFRETSSVHGGTCGARPSRRATQVTPHRRAVVAGGPHRRCPTEARKGWRNNKSPVRCFHGASLLDEPHNCFHCGGGGRFGWLRAHSGNVRSSTGHNHWRE